MDTLSWWIGADPVEVSTLAIGGRDNLQVNLRYPDDSLGTVTYFTTGNARFPKETFEAASGGPCCPPRQFQESHRLVKGRVRRTSRNMGSPDKEASAPSSMPSSKPFAPGAQCRSRSPHWSLHPGYSGGGNQPDDKKHREDLIGPGQVF